MIRLLNSLLVTVLFSGPVAASVCDRDEVLLRGDWGQARFSVEVADEPIERSQGLMHRTEMATGAGMLFVYQRPQRAVFWMKNTLIPLDMLFANRAGVVTKIHTNAIPLDETPIEGGDDVLFVLEINGGLADLMGIKAGTEMQHPAIGDAAAWPCE